MGCPVSSPTPGVEQPAGLPGTSARVLVVDTPGSPHAEAVARCARFGRPRAELTWLVPDLSLPSRLASVRSVAAVCIPVSILGAGSSDRFLGYVAEAIGAVRARGARIFVAAGSGRHRNLLADVPGAISVASIRRPRHPARLRCGDLGFESSGAVVRAGALYALFRHRPVVWHPLRSR